MFTVSNVELGLIARAMKVTPVVTDGVHSITVEDDGCGVVFQWVQKG
jgi:nitrate/nitrite-specific signal transduction histidine kinase